jgi:glycosyltransferase involved in cell wall biosynthesis
LKALHLTNYFFPEYSGTTTRLYNIVHRLPFDVTILTADRIVRGDIIALKQEQYDNILVERLPLSFGAPGRNSLPWQALTSINRDGQILVESARKREFDILHAHNSVVFGQAAARIARRTGRPFILEYHGLAHESVSGLFKGLKSYYIRRADKNVMGRCAHVITLTSRLKEWVMRRYAVADAKITVVPNGADTARFAPKPEYSVKAAELKAELGIGGKVVMYAGVMDRINGLDSIAAVVPAILAERPGVSFVFVGTGDSVRLMALRERFPRNIKLVPSVSHNDMPYYYEMGDIFVIPRPSTVSAETIVPLKLIEVMAMAKPVVASDVGGLAEVIRHGESGYLFPKGDNEALKKTLLDALDADNAPIGRNARTTVMENYTWDKAVKKLLQVYEKLA